jgi:hypothetical protein
VLLDELLARLALQVPSLSESLSSGYLSHAVVSRHLGAAFDRRAAAPGDRQAQVERNET